ncbi:MAG: hypothetical protein GY757_04960 [bacterium]|nr:hypothetical protein [bacterium]
MKMLIKKTILTVLISVFLMGSGFAQPEEIVENVAVDWWMVPLFAVDRSGNSVTDLKQADIRLFVNNKEIKEYYLNKRVFNVTDKQLVESVEKAAPSNQKPVLEKKKIIFLLFDNAVSRSIVTKKARVVAQKIVLSSEKSTRFVVMTIEKEKGLVHRIGPTNDKELLLSVLGDKVISRKNSRVPTIEVASLTTGPASKFDQYTEEEKKFLEMESAHRGVRKQRIFFDSFEALYYAINSIKENKFVYLFTEGISRAVLQNQLLPGSKSMYVFYLKKMASYLGRSGSVLFIINTQGVNLLDTSRMKASETDSVEDMITGENSLHFLAEQSGGKYLEGTNKKIIENIEKIHRAYYEISFPDFPGLKGNARRITIKSNRKGIAVHTLRSIEKAKNYSQMKEVEKEFLVLNLITRNPIIKNAIPVQKVQVDSVEREATEVLYKISLPDSFMRQEVELYKFLMTEGLSASKIERKSIVPINNKIEIRFNIKPEDKTCFALVNERQLKVLTCSVEILDEPEPEEILPEEVSFSQATSLQIEDGELKKILLGAAGYCERLKQSAFHFTCTEKIVEATRPLNTQVQGAMPDISIFTLKKRPHRALHNIRNGGQERVNSFKYFYRLIKNKVEITERREKLAIEDDSGQVTDSKAKPTGFFSHRAIFAPITLLDRERLDKYDYRLLNYKQYDGKRIAVIDAVPKKNVESSSIYGRIWIDTGDFSVIKIEANPASIDGYTQLKELAKKLKTRLYLSLDFEFDKIYNGLRFPTQVSLLEKYKGGRIIRSYKGAGGWQRNRTGFSYTNYQFFGVVSDVTSEDIGKTNL